MKCKINTQSKENQNRFSQSKKLCFIIPCFGHLPNTIIRELLYAHIQKRELALKEYKNNYDNYTIVPNRVISF